MAAILTPDAMNERFKLALQDRNFAGRCGKLAALGKELKAANLPAEKLTSLIDGLQGPDWPTAFVEKSRLIVARKAECWGYSKSFLDHASQTVRFDAARGGLLRPADAREAFLSDDCGRKLKKFLVKSPQLPCDADVLQKAWELFGENDKELVWPILARAQDEQLFSQWLEQMKDWIKDHYRENEVSGLPVLAKRFPETILELVKKDTICFKWYWVMPLLPMRPKEVLTMTLVDGKTEGSGPMRNKTHFDDALASWGWRHQYNIMLEICRALAAQKHLQLHNEKNCWGPVKLAKLLMGITSTKKYITTTQKITALVDIFSQVPMTKKTPESALCFVKLLPDDLEPKRAKEIQYMIEAFWKIVAEVGRNSRKEVLVGAEEKPTRITDFLTHFFRKLPPPLAVEQFFRILEEFEASNKAYQFVQSDICKTKDGEHDVLMARVFERYLKIEDESSHQVAKMFLVLLNDAKTMDVIHTSFDLLTQRLGGRSELGLLQSVVNRMKSLETQSQGTDEKRPPKATLPVPTRWCRFVELPRTAEPHVDLLHRILHSDAGEKGPLGAMLKEYGDVFFWDAFLHVLGAVTNPKAATIVQPNLSDYASKLSILKQLDLENIARPLPMGPGAGGDEAKQESRTKVSVYFTNVNEAKKKTYGRDASARQTGFIEMLQLAQQDKEPSKAFEDLLPFLFSRLNGEQQEVRIAVLEQILTHNALPFNLWGEKLPHLRKAYMICAKTRTPLNEEWKSAGQRAVEQALIDWKEDQNEPSELCVFGLEVGTTVKGSLDLPRIFVDATKKKKTQTNSEEAEICQTAARWILDKAVPLDGDSGTPHEVFWNALQTMAQVFSKDGYERALWRRWPFVAASWHTMLALPLKPKAAEFVLVGVIENLANSQNRTAETKKDKEGDVTEVNPWWEPVDSQEYKAAAERILGQLEAGEMPPKEGSDMLRRRIEIVLKKVQMTKEHLNFLPSSQSRAIQWFRGESWDVQNFQPLACKLKRAGDDAVVAELTTLSKVLASGRAQRQVLWQVAEVATVVWGAHVSNLLQQAVSLLQAKQEGMSRCVSRHYPYLNAALARRENPKGSCDILSPLLELWLNNDATRDNLIGEIMKRDDFEYFLFFGQSFARHLSSVRQEWLYECLRKLRVYDEASCSDEETPAEFYFYRKRGPKLIRLCQLGVSNKRCPGPHDGSGGSRKKSKGKAGKGGKGRAPPPKGKGKGKCGKGKGNNTGDQELTDFSKERMQMYLWHPDTQTEYLQKALRATRPLTLAVIPRLEHADGISRARELLASYPMEQTSKPDATETGGWEVIAASGAYSNIEDEIRRRFSELPTPFFMNAVGDSEVQMLLTALGRADDAAAAMKVLGEYASKVKQAKEAVVKMISTLSPTQSRMLIKDVMLAPKAGVALQVAALRLISELHVPNPLELYKSVWNDGKCHRDVAGNILAKVSTTPATLWSPADVRGFFDFFTLPERAEDTTYVAELLLDQLESTPKWTLPFLPDIVGGLVMVPGVTTKAMNALKVSAENVTEVIRVLTQIATNARMAVRAEGAVHPKLAKGGAEAQVITDLTKCVFDNYGLSLVTKMPLDDCDPGILMAFVDEQLRVQWSDWPSHRKASLSDVLKVWAHMLRPEEAAKWPGILSDMECKLIRRGQLKDLTTLVSTVVGRTLEMNLSAEGIGQMHIALSNFFENILDKYLCTKEDKDPEADQSFVKDESNKKTYAQEIVMTQWTKLVFPGCAPEVSGRLFARCPIGQHVTMTKTVVEGAVALTDQAQWKNANITVPEVARRAIAWLATPADVRDTHLSILIKLWAMVVSRDKDGSSFAKGLELLGSAALPRGTAAKLVGELLEKTPPRAIMREALNWLAKESPEEAVKRWPLLLTPKAGAPAGSPEASIETKDVKDLLNLCQAEGLEPPEIPALTVRQCSKEIIGLFAESAVPEARIVALQALQSRSHIELEDVQIIKKLCDDPCEIVAVAARHLKSALKSEKRGKKLFARSNSAEDVGGDDDDDED